MAAAIWTYVGILEQNCCAEYFKLQEDESRKNKEHEKVSNNYPHEWYNNLNRYLKQEWRRKGNK